MTQNSRFRVSDEDILNIFEENRLNLHEAAAKLEMTPVTLWRRAKAMGLKWSDKPNRLNNKGIETPLEEILEGKHPNFQTLKLKKKLLKHGVKENKCEKCGIVDHNGKPLTMQLDHIDGNPHNHLLENLRMLCPNCHSQTKTYSGKNK